MNVAWLVSRLIEGSGGHRTILEHASKLEKLGYQCSIYLEDEGIAKEQARAEIKRLFGYEFNSVFSGWASIAPCDAVVATIWYSADVVRRLGFECKKLYFVQDYEACFNPMGDAYIAAENSYTYGLIPITIGKYLTNKLMSEHGVESYYFDFGANLDIYAAPRSQDRRQSVCFIYQPEKPRRCARLGLEALGIVKHLRPATDIILYGSRQSEAGNIWFEHEHKGLLPTVECGELYRKASVGLCLSASNPSRIPFEMMAAGLPVVELWRENTLFDLPESAVLLAKQTPEALASAIIKLLDDNDLKVKMSEAGRQFMSNRPETLETEVSSHIIDRAIKGELGVAEKVEKLYISEPYDNFESFGQVVTQSFSSGSLLGRKEKILNLFPAFMRPVLIRVYRRVKRFLIEG